MRGREGRGREDKDRGEKEGRGGREKMKEAGGADGWTRGGSWEERGTAGVDEGREREGERETEQHR